MLWEGIFGRFGIFLRIAMLRIKCFVAFSVTNAVLFWFVPEPVRYLAKISKISNLVQTVNCNVGLHLT